MKLFSPFTAKNKKMKIKLIVFFHLLIINAYSQNKPIHLNTNHIKEEGFIRINGIEHWVTVKGDKTKPVVLFLHGGPGSPISPYADSIYGKWEKDFILVQWDQRGTGKTFGHNKPEELSPEYLKSNPLTIEQMTADGIELVNYLIKHLGKQKSYFLEHHGVPYLGLRWPSKIQSSFLPISDIPKWLIHQPLWYMLIKKYITWRKPPKTSKV